MAYKAIRLEPGQKVVLALSVMRGRVVSEYRSLFGTIYELVSFISFEIVSCCGSSSSIPIDLCVLWLKSHYVREICWPRDLLRDDMRNTRIITWGYDADVAKLFEKKSKASIFTHAINLLRDIASQRTIDKTRSLIFVGHSLGGLVIKEAIIEAASQHHSKRDLSLFEIYPSIIGVVFFGTPHRGSSMASLGDMLVTMAKISLRRPNESLLQDMKKDSTVLETQRERFVTYANELTLVTVREEIATNIGMVRSSHLQCFVSGKSSNMLNRLFLNIQLLWTVTRREKYPYQQIIWIWSSSPTTGILGMRGSYSS